MAAVLHVGVVGDVVSYAERLVDLSSGQSGHVPGLRAKVCDEWILHDEQSAWRNHGHHLVSVYRQSRRAHGERAECVTEPGLLAVGIGERLSSFSGNPAP